MTRFVTALFTASILAVPSVVAAQSPDRGALTPVSIAAAAASTDDDAPARWRGGGDSVLNGVVIGGAIGAVGGMILAPYLFCGNGFDDTECTVIVRAAIGIPVLAGSLVAGGLIDKYHVAGPVIWRADNDRAVARAGAFPTGGSGVQMVVRF